MVAAYVALFAALGGTAYAADMVTTVDIADGPAIGANPEPVVVETQTGSAPAMFKTATAFCPAGRKVVGGGGEIRPKPGDVNSHPANLVALAMSRPSGTTGWVARGEVIRQSDQLTYWHQQDTWVVHAWAICA